MNCKEQRKIEQYVNGELAGDALELVLKHMDTCHSCRKYLSELKAYEKFLLRARRFKPVLDNPEIFKSEVLERVEYKPTYTDRLLWLIDWIISMLTQPIIKYSVVSAAFIIFGVFIYQQTVIVQKISALEERVAPKRHDDYIQTDDEKNIEALLKERPGWKTADSAFQDLLNDYRMLQIKHKLLLKILKERYPDRYQEIIQYLEKAETSAENVNI